MRPNLYGDLVVPLLTPTEREQEVGADWNEQEMIAFITERTGRPARMAADGRIVVDPDADRWQRVIDQSLRRDLFYTDALWTQLSASERQQRLGIHWPLDQQLQLMSERTGEHWALRPDGRVGIRRSVAV
jgi:hypothetical protein